MMAGRDIYPSIRDERKTFRYGTNRMVELALRHELDDVARKSLDEIAVKKERQRLKPLDNEELTSRRLQPAFSPRKVREKIKREPVFHDELLENELTEEKPYSVPNIPPYNPLDKFGNVKGLDREGIKKYPYNREDTVTTQDLKKPRVTTVGVLPVRTSTNVPGLRILMEGKPVTESRDQALDEMEEANLARPETPQSAGTPVEMEVEEEEEDVTKPKEPQKKPAILGSEGTLQKMSLSVRPTRQPHPPSVKRKLRGTVRSARSVASSLRSGEIVLPDDKVYSKYDDAIAGMDADLENVQTAVGQQVEGELLAPPGTAEGGRRSGAMSSAEKSVHDMLEEAKKISVPGAEPIHKMRKKTPRKKEMKKEVVKKGKGEKGLKKKEEDKEEGPRTERTVDEIIASLRSQSKSGQTSDADRKIQEIMDRVMSRSSAVSGEESGESAEQKQETTIRVEIRPQPISEEERQSGSTSVSSSVARTPGLPDGTTQSPYLTSPSPTRGSRTDQSSPYDQETDRSELPEPIHEEKEEEGKADEKDKKDAEKYLEERQEAEKLPLAPPSTATAQPVVEPLKGLGFSDEEEEEESQVDIQKAWEDLNVPDVTHEDLVGVQGEQKILEGRHPNLPGFKAPKAPVYSNAVSFLSAWKPVGEKRKREDASEVETRPSKSVHHFCKVTTEYQLPEQFVNLGRKYHTPSRYEFAMPEQKFRFGSEGPSTIEEPSVPGSSVSHIDSEQRISAAAQRVLQEVKESPMEDDSLEAWQQRAQQVFDQPQITVEGTSMALKSDESRLYWDPAPPKLDVAPAKVKDVLFSEYQRPSAGPQEREMLEMLEESSESSEEEEDMAVVEQDREQQQHLQRVLRREHSSSEDLTTLVIAKRQREIDIEEGRINPYAAVVKAEDEEEVEGLDSSMTLTSARIKREPDDSEIFPCFVPLRRSISAPELNVLEDDTLLVPQDYNMAMREIQRQKHNVRQMKIRQKLGEAEPPPQEEEAIEEIKRVDPQEFKVTALQALAAKKEEPTPAELALAAGRAYVILPKKKKKKKEPISMARLDDIERFLSKKPRALVRSESMVKIAQPVVRELRVSSQIREGTRRSVPNLLNFEEYGNKKGLKPYDDTREWVRDIWNRWFDEVFPPTPSDSEYSEEEEVTEEQLEEKLEEEKKKKRKESLSSSIPEDMHYIEPVDETEENLEIHQIIGEEIEKLTEDMNATPKPKAFDYCRRGALYRKIGYLKAADDDLCRAIELEPLLLDAYWHRHLLYVLQDKKKDALDDLTFILKHSKMHAGAYRSMAEIYKKQDDITMAIVNYTQAIKLNPQDHEAVFARAECYEKRGDMLLALEDYSTCTKIAPTRTDAILKHGMYYFENKSWMNAINDFTDLLRVDPLNSAARVLRGRAYASMGQWSPAVEDLSAAIHLDPNNWEAFYHRACILRKAHPKRALHDYSVSLLINDTEDNIMSYLHRGILYNAMNRPEDAAPDFESVLKLNKEFACAHVNLGLIMMNHYENNHRAIKRFTSAIKVDPTYVRAYVCRGEAYHKIHELKLALRDFTRAIHLRPDVHHYYMYRGQLLLEMGNLDLAAFCVRHASEISSDSSMGKRPTQQAVVQSFLKNYDKAIDALKTATRSKPVASMFMLLGKTQMKAKQFKEATESFEQALSLYKPWKARDPWPIEAADSHYLIGQCNMEMRNYVDALEAFTNAIKLNPNMAEALYQRGTARMKLKLSKGIQDFNRALAINPRIFQAYLSRACFYGMKGQYTKAILNCNEAIKLRPTSVRAYLYRGALKYHIKAFELAIRDLSKAASIDSTCALAYFNRAVCYQENKDYQKALTDYGIVLLLGESLKLKVLINRGLLYFEKKDYCNALYDFKLAARLSPLDHKILHTLGLCYHKLDQLDEAVNVFTSCMKSQPFFLDGIIARGNVCMDYGTDEGLKHAMCDYQRAVRLDPMCLPARVNLAYTLQVSGRFMQAWRQFTTAIDLKPNLTLFQDNSYSFHRVRLKHGGQLDYEEIEYILFRAYKPALEGRSVINLQMSDTFAAYQDINAAISVNPTAELLTNRGVIYQFMGDRVNAMRDYQEAVRLDETYSLAYFNAGNVYFHTRQFSQAKDYFSLAVKYNQKDESAFLNRAITKVMLKDATGALEDFKAAIKLSPYSAHMYLNRANLYASTQQYEKAERDYTKALDLQPDDALVLKRRADVRGKLGKKEKAIRDYKQAIEIQGRSQFLAKLKKKQES